MMHHTVTYAQSHTHMNTALQYYCILHVVHAIACKLNKKSYTPELHCIALHCCNSPTDGPTCVCTCKPANTQTANKTVSDSILNVHLPIEVSYRQKGHPTHTCIASLHALARSYHTTSIPSALLRPPLTNTQCHCHTRHSDAPVHM